MSLSAADSAKLDLLPAGTFCFHKSWGVGKIQSIDTAAEQIIIDFEGKPNHTLKLSFALSSLEPLTPDHFLSQRLDSLPKLKTLAHDNPVALIELLLNSFNNSVTLDELERQLSPLIISKNDFKKWWDTAKKTIKTARHITVPSKRSDPLTMRNQSEPAHISLIHAVISANDLKVKLTALNQIQKNTDLFQDLQTLSPLWLNLTDTAKKAAKLHPKESFQLILQRDELISTFKTSLPQGLITLADLQAEQRNHLLDIAQTLPAAYIGSFYKSFLKAFPSPKWIQELLYHLPKTSSKGVSEIASIFEQENEFDVLIDQLRRILSSRSASQDLLLWITAERKNLTESLFDIDLGNAIIDFSEKELVKNNKKTGKFIEIFTADKNLIAELVHETDADELRLFAKRIMTSNVFDELTRKSHMAKIIKVKPEMAILIDEANQAQKEEPLIASWDSIERRKKELHDITNVKIPQNKKDIQIAREYGDLRENFEYKSARQQQAVLLRMQSKMEREIRNCRGTDFTNTKTDKVGIGTVVEILNLSTNQTENYTILGAWDGDIEKKIVSYLSELAKSLIGKEVNEEAELPVDQESTIRVKVLSIKAYNAP
jgi:transcription elongation GreA/GreB family factor